MDGKSDPLDSQSSFLLSVLHPGAMQIGSSIGLWYMNLQYNEQSKQLSPSATTFFFFSASWKQNQILEMVETLQESPVRLLCSSSPQLNPHLHPNCHAVVGTGIRLTVPVLIYRKEEGSLLVSYPSDPPSTSLSLSLLSITAGAPWL